jgi:phytoene/squalene synthetase
MLEKIVAADYDVFNNKIKVSKIEKVGIALGVWAKYSLVY